MKQSASEFVVSFLLVAFSMTAFYVAFLFHDALYPGSGQGLKAVLVAVLAFLGFAGLHRALHIQDPKDLNSPDDME